MSSWLLRQSEDSEEFHSASLALLRLVTGSILAHCTQATAAGAGAASDRKQAAEKQLEALAQPILAGGSHDACFEAHLLLCRVGGLRQIEAIRRRGFQLVLGGCADARDCGTLLRARGASGKVRARIAIVFAYSFVSQTRSQVPRSSPLRSADAGALSLHSVLHSWILLSVV